MALDEEQFGTFMDRVDQTQRNIEITQDEVDSSTSKMADSVSSSISNFAEEAVTTIGERLQSQELELEQFGTVMLEDLEGRLNEQVSAAGESVNETVLNELQGQLSSIFNETSNVIEKLQNTSSVTTEQVGSVVTSFEGLNQQLIGTLSKLSEGEQTLEQTKTKIEEAVAGFQEGVEVNLQGDIATEQINELKGAAKVINDKFKDVAKTQQNVGQAGFNTDKLKESSSELARAAREIEGAFPGADAIAQVNQSVETLGTTFNTVTTAINGSTVAMTALRVAALGGLVAITAAIGPVIASFTQLESAAQQFQEQTGFARDRTMELQDTLAGAGEEIIQAGGSIEGATEAITVLDEQFGSIEAATQIIGLNTEQIARRSAQISSRLGVSQEAAAELQGAFAEIEAFAGGSAEDAMTVATGLAEARGVAPQAVMEDIKESTEGLAQFSQQSTEAIAEAAVKARELGISLSDVTDLQEQFLSDINGTIQGFQQANLVAGTQLDSVSLIQAAYEGTGETVNELREQLTGMADIGQMDFFQRRALSEAFGMSPGELSRMQEVEQTLQKVDGDAAAIREKVAEGELSFADAMDAREGRTALQRLNDQLESIALGVSDEVLPSLNRFIEENGPALVDMAKGITTSLTTMLDVLLSVGDFMEDVGDKISFVTGKFAQLTGMADDTSQSAKKAGLNMSSLVGTVMGVGFVAKIGKMAANFSGLSSILGKITPSFDLFSSTVKNTGGAVANSTGKMTSALSNLKTVGGVVAILGALAGSVFVLSEAAQRFDEVGWPAIQKMGVALGMIVGVAAAATAGITIFSGAIASASPAIFTAALALGALAGAVFVASEAAQGFAQAFKTVSEGMQNLVPVIQEVGNAIKTAFQGLTGFVGSIFTGIVDVLQQDVSKMGLLAAGVSALAIAIGQLSAAGLGAGIISTLFGGDVTGQLQTLSNLATPLQTVAQSVSVLASSLQSLQDIDISAVVSQLSELDAAGATVQVEEVRTVTEQRNRQIEQQRQGVAAQQQAQVEPAAGAAPEVRTIESPQPQQQQTARGQQQQQQSFDTIESLLQQLVNSQRAFNEAIRNEGIRVDLDSRKVNKELTRGPDLKK